MSTTSGVTTLCSQWTSAWEDLIHSLANFNDASKALLSVDRRLIQLHDSALGTVMAELPNLQSESHKIIQSVTSMKRLRNASVSLGPVNRLPIEILKSIFTNAVYDSKIPRPRHKTTSTQKEPT
ncbi:hypothetical protein RhiLY_05866 [Ceratobasidium sp. AG-Ba]|nr:hypothetical protein RhiLY_05866 [Ceratobasidium sp. AG-Ba]